MTTDRSRRRLLALGTGTLGAAAAGSLLPPSLHAALAAEPAPGGLHAVKHVVILIQENRSFDHYFGTLRGVRGFGDRNAVELPSGRPVFEQPGPLGSSVLPFPVRGAAETQQKDLQYIGALDHSWNGGAKAWAGGWMNNWVSAKTAATMAYYDRRDIPLHYELADTFTICDAYHSSIHTSTSPNRNHLWSGKTGFEADGKRAVDNDAYDEGTHPGYAWCTYAERLEKAGRSWKTYSEWENFTDNQIEFFTTFKAIARKALVKTGGHTFMESFYAAVRDTQDTAERDQLLGLLEEGVAGLAPAERRLFERGLAEVSSSIDHHDRDLDLTLRNDGSKPVTFTIRPLAYVDEADLKDWTRTVTVKPGRSRRVVHSAADAHGWYDIEVTADRESGFRRRLMGHIENGRASVSG